MIEGDAESQPFGPRKILEAMTTTTAADASRVALTQLYTQLQVVELRVFSSIVVVVKLNRNGIRSLALSLSFSTSSLCVRVGGMPSDLYEPIYFAFFGERAPSLFMYTFFSSSSSSLPSRMIWCLDVFVYNGYSYSYDFGVYICAHYDYHYH